MKSCFRIIIVSTVLLASALTSSSGQQYGWRGPGRTGVYNEKGLMKSWPASGPSMIWVPKETKIYL
jgi:outer membrane protein assembly factor BamB